MSPLAARNSAPPDADLSRRRREIGRGLTRSHYAVVAASGLIGLFALAALWFGAEARRGAGEARRASALFWQFGSRAAGRERQSRRIGQREEALKIVREAAEWQPSCALRDEALSALLLPDAGTNLVWHGEPGFEFAGVYDASLDHFIQNCDHGRAIVRRAADGVPQFVAPGFGPGTSFYEFSPDGRLAAIAFPGGTLGVWDWAQSNLVAKVQMLGEADWAEPSFAFTPDGRSLWCFNTNRALARLDLATGLLTEVLTPSVPLRLVRLSPSGRLASADGRFHLNGGFRQVEVVFCGCTLSIALSGGNVVVSWPCELGGCLLEYADELREPGAATIWHPVSPQPAGGLYTTPLTGTQRYFRLRAAP